MNDENYVSLNFDEKHLLSTIPHKNTDDFSFPDKVERLSQEMQPNHPTEDKIFYEEDCPLLENDVPKTETEKNSSERKNNNFFNNVSLIPSQNPSENEDQGAKNEDLSFKYNLGKNIKNNEQLQRQCHILNTPNCSTNFTSSERKTSLLNQKTKRDPNSSEKKDYYENQNTQTKRKKNSPNENFIQNSNSNQNNKGELSPKPKPNGNKEIKYYGNHSSNLIIELKTVIINLIIILLNANLKYKHKDEEIGEKCTYEFKIINRDEIINLDKEKNKKLRTMTLEELISNDIAEQQHKKGKRYKEDNNKKLCAFIKRKNEEKIVIELLNTPFGVILEDFSEGKVLENRVPGIEIPKNYIRKETFLQNKKNAEISKLEKFNQFLGHLMCDFQNSEENQNYEFATRIATFCTISLYKKLIRWMSNTLFKFFNDRSKAENIKDKYHEIDERQILNIKYKNNEKSENKKSENKKSKNMKDPKKKCRNTTEIDGIMIKDYDKPIAETILNAKLKDYINSQLKIKNENNNIDLFKKNKDEVIEKMSKFSFRDYFFHMAEIKKLEYLENIGFKFYLKDLLKEEEKDIDNRNDRLKEFCNKFWDWFENREQKKQINEEKGEKNEENEPENEQEEDEQ